MVMTDGSSTVASQNYMEYVNGGGSSMPPALKDSPLRVLKEEGYLPAAHFRPLMTTSRNTLSSNVSLACPYVVPNTRALP